MANQKKSQQAKKVEAMGKKSGATKDQVAQGLARAGGKSSYNVTNKDIKRAGEAAKIIAGATATAVGPGKVVKAAKAVSKGANAVKFAAERANFSRGTVKVEPMLKKKASSAKIAKNSVKVVKPTDSLSRASKNIKSNAKVQEAKFGDTAKRGAKEAAEKNRKQSPYLENQVVTVRSANTKPYKITGGAGSTARRANEITDTRKLKKMGK
jgi:hypothetical protein